MSNKAIDLDCWQYNLGIVRGALLSLGANSDVMRSVQWMIDNVEESAEDAEVKVKLDRLLGDVKEPAPRRGTFKPIDNIDDEEPPRVEGGGQSCKQNAASSSTILDFYRRTTTGEPLRGRGPRQDLPAGHRSQDRADEGCRVPARSRSQEGFGSGLQHARWRHKEARRRGHESSAGMVRRTRRRITN